MTLRSAIKHPECLLLVDEQGAEHYGADQMWYPTLWQRRAGCGPTTASHLMLYLNNMGLLGETKKIQDKQSMLTLMLQLWNHVTPGIMGVHLPSIFTKGISAFLEERGSSVKVESLSIPRDRSKRPKLEELVSFITESLSHDQPVAFLNLSKGTVANLDEWHWVTIVGIKVGGEGDHVEIEVYDAGQQWVIDLKTWYETTTRSSGFVHCVA